LSSVRVLVVDDQPPFRRAAVALVGALQGFEVVGVAESGEESVAEVARLRPDLALMDVNLPGMSGLEATRRIRELHPSTVVALVSTYDRSEFGDEVEDCGASAFIPKSAFSEEAVLLAWRASGGQRDVDAEGGDAAGGVDPGLPS
jgi:DNA-binding NarL/FixJ family response regulator